MAVDTFVRATAARSLAFDIREMDDTTHTAQEAAATLGTSVAAIVKSLLFLTDEGSPVLVLASGPNRVDPHLVGAVLGESVQIADAKTVKKVTGYSIGGVPPFGHPEALRTVLDETLLELPVVWAAAGSSRAVFDIEPARLAELTDATVARVS